MTPRSLHLACQSLFERYYAWLDVRVEIGGHEWYGTDAFAVGTGIGMLLGALGAKWAGLI